MHSFSRSLLGLGALTLAGCGAPAELDEGLFPGLSETGYVDALGPGVGAAGAGSGGAPSNAGAPGVGAGGAVNPPVGGSGNVAQGGSAPVATAGGGSVSAGGSAPVGQGGSAQAGSPAEGGSEQTGGSCPDDITVLFARPGPQGGCDGSNCHAPGGTPPDLISPGVEARLVDVISTCQGRPYIGGDDGFLANKLVGDPPDCGGFAMPFGTPQALSPEDEQCILDWIDEVSGG